MKILIFLFVLFFPAFAFADGGTGFFDGIQIFFSDIWKFITVTIPEALTSFFVFLGTYALYLKFSIMKGTLIYAHSVALGFLGLFDIGQAINSAISGLPSDLRQVASDIKFFEGATLIIEATITRFVYQATS